MCHEAEVEGEEEGKEEEGEEEEVGGTTTMVASGDYRCGRLV